MPIVVHTTLTIKSPAFTHNELIPVKYSCEGQNINPPIDISELPKEAKSIAIIVDDSDAAAGTFTHWIMWNIPPTKKIEENSAPGVQGNNSRNENKYHGPCPPGGKMHHYHFKVYALDTKLNIPDSSDKKDLLKAVEGHIIATGELVGIYKRK